MPAIQPLELLRAIWSKNEMSTAERAILTVAVMRANNDDGSSFASQPTMAADIGGKPRRTKDLLKALERRGLIVRGTYDKLIASGAINPKTKRPPRRPGHFEVELTVVLPGAILALGNNCQGQCSQLARGNPCATPGATIAPKLPIRTAQPELLMGEPLPLPPPLASQAKSRRRPGTAIPDDLTPNETTLAHATKLGFDDARVERELGNLRDNALRDDKRWRDWQAAIRTWLTNAKKFEERDQGRSRITVQTSDPGHFEKHMHETEQRRAREAGR